MHCMSTNKLNAVRQAQVEIRDSWPAACLKTLEHSTQTLWVLQFVKYTYPVSVYADASDEQRNVKVRRRHSPEFATRRRSVPRVSTARYSVLQHVTATTTFTTSRRRHHTGTMSMYITSTNCVRYSVKTTIQHVL